MANIAGGLAPYMEYTDGTLNSFGGTVSSGLVTSKFNRSRGALPADLGGGPIITYLKRARDLGSSPAVYTEWTTLDIDSLPPTSPPVGPWGEIKVISEWYP